MQLVHEWEEPYLPTGISSGLSWFCFMNVKSLRCLLQTVYFSCRLSCVFFCGLYFLLFPSIGSTSDFFRLLILVPLLVYICNNIILYM